MEGFDGNHVRGRFWERHPFLVLAVLALAVRLIIMPFVTHDYELYHWALVASNIESGSGLYDLRGYFYTPGWGYIIGVMSAVFDFIPGLDVYGDRITELLPIEDLRFEDHVATTTTVAFSFMIKIPTVLCDLVVGWLIYRLVHELTGDQRKSVIASALWFLCPIAIFMAGVQAQFDSFSALLLLLTIMLVRRDRCFLAGMTFAAAFLMKFFPAFIFFVLIAYLIVRHRDDGRILRSILSSAVGAVFAIVLLCLPSILEGDLLDTLFFVTSRADTISDYNALMEFGSWAMIAVAVAGMFLAGYRMWRTPSEDADEGLFENVLLALTCSMFASIMPQYLLVLMPFLIVVIMRSYPKMAWAWVVLSFAGIMTSVVNGNIMLLDTATFLGVDPAWVCSVAVWLESILIGPFTLIEFLGGMACVIQVLGLVLILLLMFEGQISGRVPVIGAALSRMRGWRIIG